MPCLYRAWYTYFMIESQYLALMTFSPYIVFSFLSLILYVTKKTTFKKMMWLFGLTILSKYVISYILTGWDEMLILSLQIIAGFIVFFVLVTFVQNTSWETILTTSSMISFTPLVEGVPAFVATYIFFIIYSIFSIRWQGFKDVVYDGFVSSGFGQVLPSYEHLPDKEDKKGRKRVTLLPFILVAYSLNALYYILSPYWMES